ncbi:MAG: hypothetical protein K1X61_10545 [Chitinophagales bacterium]|nr:hypothetical protein [Chitinophagales bacterium]
MCRIFFLALVGWLFPIHIILAQCLGSCCTTASTADVSQQLEMPQHRQWVIGVSLLNMQYKPLSDDELLQYATASASVYSVKAQSSIKGMISYGISKRMSLTASLPFNLSIDNKEGHFHPEESAAEIHTYGNIDGIGDGVISVSYTFIDNREKGWKAFAGAGIKMPTGKTDAYSTYAVVLPVHLQPGTGSWDPLLNVAVQKQLKKWLFISDTHVKVATTAKEHNMGTYVNTKITAGYDLLEQENRKILPLLRCTAGFSGDYNAAMRMIVSESHQHGADSTAVPGSLVSDPNTGFTRLFANASITAFITDRLYFPVSFSLPLAQALNGHQARIKSTAILGISFIL